MAVSVQINYEPSPSIGFLVTNKLNLDECINVYGQAELGRGGLRKNFSV